MPSSRFVAPLVRGFEALITPLWAVHFAGVHVASIEPATADDERALLLTANHVSWWDGFLLRAVQRRLRSRSRLTTVIAAAQLARFPFFRLMGAIGVDRNSVGSVRTLLTTIASTRQSQGSATTVAYFPQGRIWPSTVRPLGVQSGVLSVAKRLAPVTIQPVALHIEPLTTMRPHAFVLLGRPIVYREGTTLACVDAALTDTLDRLQAFLEETGEDAARLWPAVGWSTASPPSARRPSYRAAR